MTNVVIAQATEEPEVIIYVDADGVPVNTIYKGDGVPIATQFPAPPAASSTTSSISSSIVISRVSIPSPVPTTTTTTPSASPTSTSSTLAAQSSAASYPTTGGDGYGLTYSPYNSDGSCKTASQVLTDFEGFGSGYSFVRTYGIDCDTVPNVLAACKAQGMKLMAGIFSLSDLESSVSTIVSGAGDFSSLYAVSVGNELVNSGLADAASVVASISTVRTLLRTAGFKGPVVTVDTLVATRSNPSLCDASDFCAVNCHPFFDGGVEASGSGDFLTTQIATLKAVLADQSQDIVVTETGWPSKGDTNGKAVPSTSNQASAISSIKAAFSSNPAGITLFNPYNMMWKTSSAAQFQAEPYWGFLGNNPSG